MCLRRPAPGQQPRHARRGSTAAAPRGAHRACGVTALNADVLRAARPLLKARAPTLRCCAASACAIRAKNAPLQDLQELQDKSRLAQFLLLLLLLLPWHRRSVYLASLWLAKHVYPLVVYKGLVEGAMQARSGGQAARPTRILPHQQKR